MSENAWTKLESALVSRADQPFLCLGSHEFSGAQTLEHTARAARRLEALALVPHELVAVAAEPSAACVLTLLALWRHKKPVLLLNPREPESVRNKLLQRGRCRLVMASEPRHNSKHRQLAWVDLLGSDVELPRLPEHHAVTLPGAATVVSTSGSSSAPKLVVAGLAQHIASAEGAQTLLQLAEGDRWLLALPLFHVGGLGIVIRSLLAQASVHISPAGTTLAQAITQCEPSHISLVATQLARLLGQPAPRTALGQAKTVLIGGGPISLALREAAVEAGVPLVVSYGSSEGTSLVTATRVSADILQRHCAGPAAPKRTVEVDADGEIRIGGDTLLTGYLIDETVVDPREHDGMFATGDLGRIDNGGRLWIEGRKDQMFISGGENIHPEEIEEALLSIPGVEAAVVVPLPSAEYGSRPAAFVSLSVGTTLTAEALADTLATQIVSYKVPDFFWRLPDAAQAGFKQDRVWLRELAAAPHREAERTPV